MTKYQELIEQKNKIKIRLDEVKERRKQEKGNEDTWPGHGGPGFIEEENEYQLLSAHLEEIEKELKNLG